MTQPTLFNDEPERGAHRHEDPDTSVDAANSVDATALEAEVLTAFRAHTAGFGLTSEDVAQHLRMELGSVTPRFRPLEAKGYIYRTTERRPGKSGRNRIVWKLVPKP
jgi:DNA-binding MarR family transcriptional regulator